MEALFFSYFDIVYRAVLSATGFTELKVRSPETLAILLVIPFIFMWGFLSAVSQRRSARRLGMRFPAISRLFMLAGICVALSGLIIAWAEPYSITVQQRPIYKGEAVDFVLDLSASQRAQDILPSRLEAAKVELSIAVDLMKAKGISYFCLSYFTMTFNRLLECTGDMVGFKDALKRVDTSFAQGKGTNLVAAFGEDYSFLRETIPADTRITAVVVTDGGIEMCRLNSGGLQVVERDWRDEDLQKRISQLVQDKIRIIPIGVGGEEFSPVPETDRNGRKYNIACVEGGTLMTRLDVDPIKKIALWAGDSKRYFILNASNRGTHELSTWLASFMTAELVVDHYVPEAEISELKFPLELFICFAAFICVLGPVIMRIFARIFGKKSP